MLINCYYLLLTPFNNQAPRRSNEHYLVKLY
nr:MAG TPA: hypothetical protein [Bacteriophage sp.]DAR01908.1 MAG TPA: hypothetical protein [Crassvirales sp.]